MTIIDEAVTDHYSYLHADACEAWKGVPDDSVDLHVHSPPFSNLYVYSDSVRDMGNAASDDEFFRHYEVLIPELLRTTRPGRLCVIHVKHLAKYMNRDGAAGLGNFPERCVLAFERHGWVLHSHCTIWKDPVVEMQRTKSHGLLYKELCKDSTGSRQGMADFLIAFRKWTGDEALERPVTAGPERFEAYSGLNPPDCDERMWVGSGNDRRRPTGWFLPPRTPAGKWPSFNPYPAGSEAYRQWSILVWQKYASPVWDDIDQMDVLNVRAARDPRDEKHLCPLQLGVIERVIHLWTNPGDVVGSAFGGIASEGYEAVLMGRKFLGTELKQTYWAQGVRNLERAVRERAEATSTLFGGG